uniref:Glutathione S-transferase family protein n=1 Tax=Phenylobacterium glaciei TaxID=2803784 RepID=A0A974P234_9CAUL|nr:glutathione S-transferase family protein [Phenylobacterium glaciei]
MLTLYDHPLSPYAQKVKIALREKGQPFQAVSPGGLGAGGAQGDFLAANPRAEVPALVDGETAIFDSTIILEYIEDRWPNPALLPASPAERAGPDAGGGDGHPLRGHQLGPVGDLLVPPRRG